MYCCYLGLKYVKYKYFWQILNMLEIPILVHENSLGDVWVGGGVLLSISPLTEKNEGLRYFVLDQTKKYMFCLACRFSSLLKCRLRLISLKENDIKGLHLFRGTLFPRTNKPKRRTLFWKVSYWFTFSFFPPRATLYVGCTWMSPKATGNTAFYWSRA